MEHDDGLFLFQFVVLKVRCKDSARALKVCVVESIGHVHRPMISAMISWKLMISAPLSDSRSASWLINDKSAQQ
ncbi:hypothetical protein ACLOJK_033043, partial [Asimina triloba]